MKNPRYLVVVALALGAAVFGWLARDPRRQETTNTGKRLERSDDYWAFAESVIGAAKAGDGDARYWLALALNDCQYVYPIFFNESLPGKPPRRLTLDEARQRVAGKQSRSKPDLRSG